MSTDIPPKMVLTANEAARALRCSRGSVYRLVREGQLTALRVGAHGSFRFRPSDFEELRGRQRVVCSSRCRDARFRRLHPESYAAKEARKVERRRAVRALQRDAQKQKECEQRHTPAEHHGNPGHAPGIGADERRLEGQP